MVPRGERDFGRRAYCKQHAIILQRKDVLGLFYTRVIEGKKNHVDVSTNHPFEITHQMRLSDFQKQGGPPALQLLVMGSGEITVILKCNHLFVIGVYQSKVICCSFLISVFSQSAVLMFLCLKGQKLVAYSLFAQQ